MISHEELQFVLDYNPETGEFIWKNPLANRMKPGDRAGSRHKEGYIHLSVKGKFFQAHRLAWYYTYGQYPVKDIDHINGIRSDNRMTNLRLATESENSQNQRVARKDNRVGLLGVGQRGNKFIARIMIDRKPICLGTFSTKEEAYEAYLTAKRKLHVANTL